jgi:hypothetical protein
MLNNLAGLNTFGGSHTYRTILGLIFFMLRRRGKLLNDTPGPASGRKIQARI